MYIFPMWNKKRLCEKHRFSFAIIIYERRLNSCWAASRAFGSLTFLSFVSSSTLADNLLLSARGADEASVPKATIARNWASAFFSPMVTSGTTVVSNVVPISSFRRSTAIVRFARQVAIPS